MNTWKYFRNEKEAKILCANKRVLRFSFSLKLLGTSVDIKRGNQLDYI